ncbi:MAG TPA: AAA family ATPase [Actinomycetota bacterium]|nr:AAA family ATPase [Actinomycetota bacterium]
MSATSTNGELLERERELEIARESIDRARAGEGSVLAIEGEAGIGKTWLLEHVRDVASNAGLRTLVARGLELEREFAFGIVTQLFQATLARATDEEREELLKGPARLALPALHLEAAEGDPWAATAPAARDPAFATLHGLYWLVANLTDAGPLALAIDDAHWGDEASIRFLHFLAPRLHDVPVLLVLALRSGEEAVPVNLPRLLKEGGASVMLAPLSEPAVEKLVRDRLSPTADEEFCRACHRATGGNPFLLNELLPELRDRGVEPTGSGAAEIAQLAPQAISRSVLVRLAHLPPEAASLAKAVAILGDNADLARAAKLTAMDRSQAGVMADALARADIFNPGPTLVFKHPLIRAAVESELDPAERAESHGQAAALLRQDGASAEQVAVHLLETWPGDDPEIVSTLRAAAASSLARGGPATAVTYLRRATTESVEKAIRAQVLGELGAAEIVAGDVASAISSLEGALADTVDPVARAPITLLLARARLLSGQPGGVLPMILEAIDAVEAIDPELATRLDWGVIEIGVLLEPGFVGEPVFPWAKRRIYRMRTSEIIGEVPLVEIARAIMHPSVGESTAEETRVGLERALPVLLKEQGCESVMFWSAVYVLTRTEAFDAAMSHAETGLAEARTRGSAMGFMLGSSLLAELMLRKGDVSAAVAQGESGADAARTFGFAGFPHPPSFLTSALVERGELERAGAILEDFGLSGALPDISAYWNVLEPRAKLKAARGDLRGAADDLLSLDREFDAPGYNRSFYFFPNATAGPILAQLGEGKRALELVTVELDTARRWGAPGQIGMDLRALGLIQGGAEGIDALREAVETLASSNRRLEHARALVDLGASIRRAGHRADAREPLREGHEMARACGSTPLEERAAQELVAAGSRPRSVLRTGLDELTPSEHRVAEMAAGGKSNPEIAAELFLTTKTIETHLSHVYRKLRISSRRDLPRALRPGGA